MSEPGYPRVASFKTPEALRAHLERGQIPLAFDDSPAPASSSALARPFESGGVRVGNRFCILPMEGWDGSAEGEPTELTARRWRNFGSSGAKLIWGGEAVAVRQDGRANPNQLLLTPGTQGALEALRAALVVTHRERFGPAADRDLRVGLQLTHSGRYACPSVRDRPEPLTAYVHPVLDRRFPRGLRVLRDEELGRLVEDFVRAACLARDIGFDFVDLKHCHGYLAHELLGARRREGPYGGSFENRTRFLREVVAGIRTEAPGLGLAVRVSVFDAVPYRKGPDGVGVPEARAAGCIDGFGVFDDDLGLGPALPDGRELMALLQALDVRWVCITAGSPYYNPHVQRPALFPPTDGYLPPEDPLRGVARQIEATARLKAEFPGLVFVGSAYSYLQEWLPNVAERVVRQGEADFVGLGRLALSYPDMPADLLADLPLRRKLLCRTFSDCTTAPRNGMVSGCYPLDPFYARRPEASRLAEVKKRLRV